MREAVSSAFGIGLEAGAQQGHRRAFRRLEIAAGNIGVADVELGDHLAHQVVEILARGHVLDQRAVARAQRVPVVAVHVRYVEIIAEPPPDLVEYHGPLDGRGALHDHVAGSYGLGVVSVAQHVALVGIALAHDHVLAVCGQRQPGNPFGHGLAFALFDIERLERGLDVALSAVVERSADDVQQMAVGQRDAGDVVGIHRYPDHALVEALEINDYADLFVIVLGFLFALVFSGSRDGFVVARAERVGRLGRQGIGEDAGFPVHAVVPFERADLRRELAVAEKKQVLAVAPERRAVGREEAVAETSDFVVVRRPYEDARIAVVVPASPGQPARIGCPDIVGHGLERAVGKHPAIAVQVHDVNPASVIVKGDAFAVRRPDRPVQACGQVAGQGPGFASVLGHHVELLLAASVADEGYMSAVARPGGLAVVRVAALGQVARDAVLDRHREYVAARGGQHTLAVRRNAEILDLIGHFDPPGDTPHAVVGHAYLQLPGLVVGGVVKADAPGHFVDDALPAVAAGPLDVPVVVFGKLPVAVRGLVVLKKLQRAVAIGDVIQTGFKPDRVALGANVIGDLAGLVVFQVVDEQVLRPAALVAFPGTEVAEQRRVENALAVRRIVAGAGARHRQRYGQAAGYRHAIKPAVVEVVATGTEQHCAAVGRPAEYLVVGAPARRQRTRGGVVGQLLRLAAGGRNHVDLLVAAVLAGKRDRSAVG